MAGDGWDRPLPAVLLASLSTSPLAWSVTTSEPSVHLLVDDDEVRAVDLDLDENVGHGESST